MDGLYATSNKRSLKRMEEGRLHAVVLFDDCEGRTTMLGLYIKRRAL